MRDKGVCKTATATPGLLNIFLFINLSMFIRSCFVFISSFFYIYAHIAFYPFRDRWIDEWIDGYNDGMIDEWTEKSLC